MPQFTAQNALAEASPAPTPDWRKASGYASTPIPIAEAQRLAYERRCELVRLRLR